MMMMICFKIPTVNRILEDFLLSAVESINVNRVSTSVIFAMILV